MRIEDVFEKIKGSTDWDVIFENKSPEQGEILLLTGMFSGAGFLGLFQHGARKSLVFVKLIKLSSSTTEVNVIAGGTESWLGFDFGRHKRNVNQLFSFLEEKYARFER